DQRRIAGDLSRDSASGFEQSVLGVVNIAHESDFEGALSVDVLACKRQLSSVAVANDSREALQAADVGHHRYLHLAQAEARINRAESDVASRYQIQSAADAPARHPGNHRLATPGYEIASVLHAGDQLEQTRATGREVLSAELLSQLAHHRGEVQPIAEVPALAANNHGANLIVAVEPSKGLRHLAPEVGAHRIALARANEDDFRNAVSSLDS